MCCNSGPGGAYRLTLRQDENEIDLGIKTQRLRRELNAFAYKQRQHQHFGRWEVYSTVHQQERHEGHLIVTVSSHEFYPAK